MRLFAQRTKLKVSKTLILAYLAFSLSCIQFEESELDPSSLLSDLRLLQTANEFTAKDITSYSIPSIGATGLINGTEIYLIAENLNNLNPLVATFTSSGKSVRIGSTTQISGSTENSYTETLTYVVSARDNSEKTYKVKLFAPRTVSASNLKAWFKGNSLSLANGSNVSFWADSSGNSNDVSTASNFPTFLANAKNGFPAVLFPGGVDRSLAKTGGTDLNTTAHTILTVFKPVVAVNIVIISIGTGGCGITDKVFQILNDGTINTGVCNAYSINLSSVLNSNTYYIAAVSSINNTGTPFLFLDGTSTVGTFSGNGSLTYTNPNSNMAIGKRAVDNSSFFNGEIAEVLYYNTNLSVANTQTLICYLSKKYAIPVSSSCF
ncbi:MAG: hypothetical protein CK427_11220 [Leptospira sp.]|nr:MAG: hypothetical protein CK427_11220 [Leptospira sp.]